MHGTRTDDTTALILISSDPKSSYGWNDKIWRDYSSSSSDYDYCNNNSEPSIDVDKNKKRLSVSYSHIQDRIEHLCPILSSYIFQNAHRAGGITTKSGTQPVIAISIPEGPYLVLAVLTVHRLACQCQDRTITHHAAPVIVPIDPIEGNDRICQMIEDSKPCIILVNSEDDNNTIQPQPSKDWRTINEALRILETSNTYFSRPLVLGMKSLLQESLLKNNHLNIDLPHPSQALDTYMKAKNESSHDEGIEISNCVSHIVFTSGSTGRPKGCISSLFSLWHYVDAKNNAHDIVIRDDDTHFIHQTTANVSYSIPRVLLASSLSFDPCLSDIIATYYAKATLLIASRHDILHHLNMVLQESHATHVLCTPSLWNTLSPFVHSRRDVVAKFPYLKVVALGGEPIPNRLVSLWAEENPSLDGLKLLATYGVTEACVYQTAGEIYCSTLEPQNVERSDIPRFLPSALGQDVGHAFRGTSIRICQEPKESHLLECDIVDRYQLIDVDPLSKHECGMLGVGEVVLSGCQLDELSSYLNLPEMTSRKFIAQTILNRPTNVRENMIEYFYRTGDRGYFDHVGHLRIIGRINGEEKLIKYNGVRIELGEIENAIQDPLFDDGSTTLYSIVERCVVVSRPKIDENEVHHLLAYCVLSKVFLGELGFSSPSFTDTFTDDKRIQGVLCTPSPLLTLLRHRCRNVRMGITPSSFIILQSIPLTPTGKCNYKLLPTVDSCELLSNVASSSESCLLMHYGRCGHALSDEIVSCLNISACHMSLVRVNASFAILGGDSLAATRVVRGLYARHHNIANVRTLGGSFGVFEGPFNVAYLLSSANLKEYVDFLDKENVLPLSTNKNVSEDIDEHETTQKLQKSDFLSDVKDERHEMELYNALYESVSRNETLLSIALINEGADPNRNDHGQRLGKACGWIERKESFRSNPLHLACLHGNCVLVAALLKRGCNCKSPDSNGQFPIHLACTGPSVGQSSSPLLVHDQHKRIECVRLLLNSGKVPITIKNSSKQSILHCASRGGHEDLLKYILDLWIQQGESSKHGLNWLDHWKRSAIHWAVLNSNLGSLSLLLEYGCDPNPKRQRKSDSSVVLETPLEMALRIHGAESIFTRLLSEAVLAGKISDSCDSP